MAKLLLDLPQLNQKRGDPKTLINQINQGNAKAPVMAVRKGGQSQDIVSIITNIKASVAQNLGKYADRYTAIRDEDELGANIDKCIKNKICSIDTETTSLDPLTTTIAGFSIFTPGEKAAYIPINHRNYITFTKLKNQLSEQFCAEQLQRLRDNDVKLIFFNAKFDIRVIKHTLGVKLNAYFDSYIAAKLLNENEEECGE